MQTSWQLIEQVDKLTACIQYQRLIGPMPLIADETGYEHQMHLNRLSISPIYVTRDRSIRDREVAGSNPVAPSVAYPVLVGHAEQGSNTRFDQRYASPPRLRQYLAMSP